MKKLLLTALVVAAVGIYSYNAFLLFRPESSTGPVQKKTGEELSVEKLLARSQPVRFIESDRDPFLPRPKSAKNAGKPAIAVKPAVAASAVAAPMVTINGIMWDPQSPLAMITLPDGTSATVKNGETIGEITIKKIEKERLFIVFKGTSFRIDR